MLSLSHSYGAAMPELGAGATTPPPPQQVPLSLTEMPFDGYVFDAAGQTSGIATIRGTGTPNASVQARGASAAGTLPWTVATIASDGAFEINVPVSDEAAMANWYVPEVRYGTDDTTRQTGANTFSCGDVIGLLGQSELAYFLLPTAFYATGYTRTIAAENLTVMLDGDTGGGITTARITPATVTSANVGSLALAHFWNHVRPGRKLMLVDLAHPGTGPQALADDSATDRSWTALQAMVDLVRSGGGDLGAVLLNWYNAPAATIAAMHDNWAPFLFGQTSAGTTFALGAPGTGPVWTSEVDHCLYDLDAIAGDRGRGVFARARTPLLLFQPMPFNNNVDAVEDTAFDETPRISNPQRAGVLDLAASAQFQAVGALMPSTHIVDFEGSLHPANEGDPFGIPQFAMLHAPGLLGAVGAAPAEPQITDITVIDARTLDVVVSLPNGGTLTTIRALAGLAAPTTEPPHYQPVTGFQVSTNGVKRPIYKVTETGYPVTHRGTVTIMDTGSGSPRVGRVRIALEDDLATGDRITYLDGQATAILQTPRDVAAKLYLDMLIEHVPALYDATAAHPFHGMPVRPQPDLDALTIAASTASAFKATGNDAHLTGPTLPSGVSGITFEIDAAIGEGAAPIELVEYTSTSFQVRLDARSGKRGLVLTLENSTGSKMFVASLTGDGVLPIDQRGKLVVSATLDRGDGTAEMGVYVNDVLQGPLLTAANAGPTTFATNRALELLNDTGAAMTLYSARIWHGYTADGATSGLGSPVHQVSGAATAWNAPGSGLAKAGSGSFT